MASHISTYPAKHFWANEHRIAQNSSFRDPQHLVASPYHQVKIKTIIFLSVLYIILSITF